MKSTSKFIEILAKAILILFASFTVLKLIGVINWSWWWVTSPLWIAVIIELFAISMLAILMMLIKVLLKISQRKINKDLNEL